jgi:hypothetical protein
MIQLDRIKILKKTPEQLCYRRYVVSYRATAIAHFMKAQQPPLLSSTRNIREHEQRKVVIPSLVGLHAAHRKKAYVAKRPSGSDRLMVTIRPGTTRGGLIRKPTHSGTYRLERFQTLSCRRKFLPLRQ